MADMVYKILFSGKLKAGFQKDEVISATAEFLKIPVAKASHLFSGKTFALAKNLDAKGALDKTKQFESLGLDIRVVKESLNEENVSEQSTVTFEKLYETAMAMGKKVQASLEKKRSSFTKSDTPEDSSEGSTRKKRRGWQLVYFKIVKWFSFFVATAAIIIVIVAGSSAFSTVFLSAGSESQTERPVTFEQLDDIQQQLEDARYETSDESDKASDETRQKQIDQANRQREFEKQINEYFARFESAINLYAKELGQKSVKEVGIENIKAYIQDYDDLGEQYRFWDLSASFAEDLSSAREEIAQLNEGNLRKVQWVGSLEKLARNYELNIQAKQQEERNRAAQRAASLVEASQALMIAGGAFIVFMFFTVILVLLKIEMNTRPKEA